MRKSGTESLHENSISDKGFNILVAEDDTALNHLLTRSLKRGGFSTRTALNGADAVREALNDNRTLLVLDYHLPDMNGDQVISMIHAKGADVPFIVITGAGDEKTAFFMCRVPCLNVHCR